MKYWQKTSYPKHGDNLQKMVTFLWNIFSKYKNTKDSSDPKLGGSLEKMETLAWNIFHVRETVGATRDPLMH